MKNIYIIAILLFSNTSFIFSQEFKSGYLTFKNGKTIEAPIYLTLQNHIKVKRDSVKIKKIKKSKLLDFGYIENNQRHSKYASWAFKKETYNAIYITLTNDTIPFYFLISTQLKIKGYSKNRKSINISPNTVKQVIIFKKNNSIVFDRVDLGSHFISKKLTRFHFLERKISGKISLYGMFVKKKILEELENPIHIYTPHQGSFYITHKVSSRYTFVHIIKKNNKITLVPYHYSNTKAINLLQKITYDCPTVFDKIGTEGYHLANLFTIAEEYNQYWNNMEIDNE